MKRAFYFLIPLSVYAYAIKADSLTLDDCQKMALQNYPNLRNVERQDELYRLATQKINTSWFPQVSLNGQAAYQSDVFELPFTQPGMDLVEIPHERYQATVDISQTIYDGGINKGRKSVERERLRANQRDLQVEFYELEKTVNEIFFGILLSQKNDSILQQTLELLHEREKAVRTAQESGTAAMVDVLRLETEILNVNRQVVENAEKRQSLLRNLEILLGENMENAILQAPELPDLPGQMSMINRPEIAAVMARTRELEAQSQSLLSELRPKVSAFFSGGAGAPNPYNFYDVEFSSYYNAGIKLSWKLFDWKASAYDRQTLQIRSDMLADTRENIERNIETKLANISGQIEMLNRLTNRDQEIIAVREQIRDLSSLRLEEGVISSTEYLEDVNAEKTAKMVYEARRIQMLKAAFDYILEAGNERTGNLEMQN